MSAIGTYGFVNAKVRAMRSYLLGPSRYHHLAESKDYAGLISGLAETAYKADIDRYDTDEPEDMEAVLFRHEVDRLQTIHKNCKGNLRRFMSLLLERYETERLKSLLRIWHKKLPDVPDHLRLPVLFPIHAEEITDIDNYSGLIRLWAGTPCEPVLRDQQAAYEKKQSLFPVELALDRDIFQRIRQANTELNRKDRAIADRLIGIEIDIKNFQWIYRLRHYYDVASADMVEMLLPAGYRLNQDRIQKLIISGNAADMLTHLVRGLSSVFSSVQDNPDNWDRVELILYQMLFREARAAFAEFPFSIGALLGYFYLIRIESRNIKTLVFAKQYGMEADKVEPLLVY